MKPGTLSPIQPRIRRVLVGFLVACSLLFVRAVHLQMVGDARLASLGKRQFESRVLVRPKRGPILDRNGDLLATNDEARSLAADPSKVRDPARTAVRLSRALGQPAGEIEAKLRSRSRFVWLRRQLPRPIAERLRDLDDGVWLIEESLRVYPHGHLAGQVLGSVNLDSEGLEGVELVRDSVLRGDIVSIRAIKDAMGRPSFIDAKAVQEIKHGSPVQLTIDAALQSDVEQKLAASVRAHNARSGLALVMHAHTGDLLAVAHVPFFDPHARNVSLDSRRLRALTDGYEPGSVLKPLLMAAALKSGIRSNDREWGGLGEVIIQGKRIGEAEEHEKFEWLTLADMVKVSSNVGAAKFALRLGAQKYFGFLKDIGLTTRSGLGIPGEIAGMLPTVDQAKPLRLANVGFGQGLLATPIQILRAYAALFNQGLMPSPRVFAEEASSLVPVMTPAVADAVVQSLIAVIEDEKGTGRKAHLPGYRLAGKTATAQVVDPLTRKYSTHRYLSSFTGALMDGVRGGGRDAGGNTWVILALMDVQTPHYYAGDVVAPLFRDLAESVALRYGVQPDPQLLLASAEKKPKAKSTAPVRDSVVTTAARVEVPVNIVPDLKGMGARQAVQALTSRGARIQLEGFGVVRSQFPSAGTSLSEGQSVRVQLGE